MSHVIKLLNAHISDDNESSIEQLVGGNRDCTSGRCGDGLMYSRFYNMVVILHTLYLV